MTGVMQHRKQRGKVLNPVSSSSQLRDMSQIFYRVARKVLRLPTANVISLHALMAARMQNAISARFARGRTTESPDVNGWMTRITLEILGQTALRYSFDNFAEDSTDQYGGSVKLFL